MKETSPSPKYTDRIRSWVNSKANGGTHHASRRPEPDLLPISSPRTTSSLRSNSTAKALDIGNNTNANSKANPNSNYATNNSSNHNDNHNGVAVAAKATTGPAAPSTGGVRDGTGPVSALSPQASRQGSVVAGEGSQKAQRNIAIRFLLTLKQIMFYSKLNIMLVFVPIGIIVQEIPGTTPVVKFTMNALAIIPLAGLLSYATESVARKLGDSLGALLNVTFGNAVELIIL